MTRTEKARAGRGRSVVREIDPADRQSLDRVIELHREQCECHVDSCLGEGFVRRFRYGVLVRDRLVRVALAHVEDRVAGFIAYASHPSALLRRAIGKRRGALAWHIARALVEDVRRLACVPGAVRALRARHFEDRPGGGLVGEIFAMGVQADGRRAELVAEDLVTHAATYFQRAGIPAMRAIVDADDAPALSLYRRLGARCEPVELPPGRRAVDVRFDVGRRPAAAGLAVPPCWALEPDRAGDPDPQDHWRSYWEGLEERLYLRAEAVDYVARLEASVRIDTRARVLDFGCGFGFVAEILAPKVGELFLWDASSNMRRRARLRVAGQPNVRFLDLTGSEPWPAEVRFDLILVNSVVQYMTFEEFCRWLGRWRDMLAPDGRLIMSDLVPHDAHPVREVAGVLALGACRGMLMRAVWDGLCELRRYSTARRARPLHRIDHGDLCHRAAELGLAVELLPRNLTHQTGRTAVVLSRRPTGVIS